MIKLKVFSEKARIMIFEKHDQLNGGIPPLDCANVLEELQQCWLQQPNLIVKDTLKSLVHSANIAMFAVLEK